MLDCVNFFIQNTVLQRLALLMYLYAFNELTNQGSGNLVGAHLVPVSSFTMGKPSSLDWDYNVLDPGHVSPRGKERGLRTAPAHRGLQPSQGDKTEG